MIDKEILNKAIKKAESNGWNSPTFDSKKWFNIEAIIFDHDFAKAFWGEEQYQNYIYHEDLSYANVKYVWQYHLQQMILEKELLKYLEKFLEE